MILLLILYMLFASTFTIGKAALDYSSPIFFIAIRMMVAGALLMAYHATQHDQKQLQKKDGFLFFSIAFFSYYIAFIFEFIALQSVASSKACLIFNSSPFVTAALSFAMYGERLTIKKSVGLVIGFLGLIPILLTTSVQEELAGGISWLSIPEFLLIGSVISSAYGWLTLKKAQNKGYATTMINGYAMGTAGVMSLATSLIFESAPRLVVPPICEGRLCEVIGPYGASVAHFVLYALALITISNIVCFNLYGYLLTIYSATFVSFAGFVTPLFGALFGLIFFDEHIGWHFFASLGIVFVGLLIFFQEELRANT